VIPPIPVHPHPAGCACDPACAYLRVSTMMGRQEIVSWDIQLAECVTAASRKGLRIVKIVADIKSGKTFAGRQVAEIVTEIGSPSPAYRHVLLWKWSRWGRNVEQSLAWLLRVQKAGGKVESATEDVNHKTSTGRLTRDMIWRFDQFQLEQITEGWVAVHDNRRRNGLPHSGRPRVGYTYVDKHYEVEPVAADELVNAYQRYVDGTSLDTLAGDWNARGLRTGRGGDWSAQAMGRMLDSGFGAGYIRERSDELKTAIKEKETKIRQSINGYDVWRLGAHAAVVGDDLWQAYRSRRAAQADTPPRARTAVHELSSLLRCGICGHLTVTKYGGRDRLHCWVCPNIQAGHPDRSVSISNRNAVTTVRAWVTSQATGGDTVDARTARAQAATRATADIGRSEKLVNRLKAKLLRIKDMHADGDYTPAEYRARKDHAEKELRHAYAELAQASAAQAATGAGSIETFKTLDAEWDSFAPEFVRRMLREVVGVAVVYPAARTRALPGEPVASDRLRIVPVWELHSFVAPWPALRR
jgi:site-specific DNA recombinase